jgi:hypothetical protein
MFIVKPGVREMNDESISDDYQDDSFNVKQLISSQDEAVYDVFMLEFKLFLVIFENCFELKLFIFNRNLIPDNIVSATFMSHYTALVPINPNNLTLGYKKVSEKAFKSNMLGLCVFSLILGFAILHLESKAENIKKLLEETNAVVMKIMMTLIK